MDCRRCFNLLIQTSNSDQHQSGHTTHMFKKSARNYLSEELLGKWKSNGRATQFIEGIWQATNDGIYLRLSQVNELEKWIEAHIRDMPAALNFKEELDIRMRIATYINTCQG